ncbi:hypothetical protein, partial [Stenotrophomonas indicatrix]
WDLAEITLFVAAWLIAIGVAAIAIKAPSQYQFQLFAVLLGLYALLSGSSALVHQVLVVIELHEIKDDAAKLRSDNS